VTGAWSGGPPRRVVGVLTALVVGLVITGCKEIEETSAPVHQPAKVEEVAGLDVKRVTFDQEAADQVTLQTAQVRQAGRGEAVVPYAALIYDSQGVAWVYTNPAPLTFQREKVVVDRVIDDKVWITAGPKAGTRVVTTGATEVYGAELDIAGGH
jgi:hypothetical protein